MTIDRRKFLAGTALGAVTAVFLDKQEAKAGNVSGYKARFAMIFDQNKCVGCGACKDACHFRAIEVFPIKEQKLL